MPVARLWVAKLIIDSLVAGVAVGRTDLAPLAPLVAIEFALTALGTLAGQFMRGGGYGVVGDIVLGIISAFIGAVILIALARALTGSRAG